jgi:hypothetical protein
MLQSQFIEPDRVRFWSSEKYYIRQIETGVLYEDAVHTIPAQFSYEETDELIPETEAIEEL